MSRARLRWGLVFLLPITAMFAFLYAVPLFKVVYTSFFELKLRNPVTTFVGLRNYITLFTTDKTFSIALRNTGAWILLHTFLHVGIGVFMALVLNRKPRGWKVVRTVYMCPNIIALSAMALIWKIIYNPDYGMLNVTLRALGLDAWTHNWLFDPRTAFWSVTMTWFLYAGYTCTLVLARLLSIPDDLYDAARIDGCNSIQLDVRVLLPIAKDTISVTMIMAASYMLTMFPLIYMTTAGGPGKMTYNLPLYLYTKAMIENNYGYANAVGVFIIICGIAIMNLIKWLMREREARL